MPLLRRRTLCLVLLALFHSETVFAETSVFDGLCSLALNRPDSASIAQAMGYEYQVTSVALACSGKPYREGGSFWANVDAQSPDVTKIDKTSMMTEKLRSLNQSSSQGKGPHILRDDIAVWKVLYLEPTLGNAGRVILLAWPDPDQSHALALSAPDTHGDVTLTLYLAMRALLLQKISSV